MSTDETTPADTVGDEELREKYEGRTLDMAALKGLAHPLRVQLLDALSVYGPNTASGLAERFGESSGATSYHLRQLEKHGFVREVEGRGSGRERWWERVPGGISLPSGSESKRADAATRAAGSLVNAEWGRGRQQLLDDFGQRHEELADEWLDLAIIHTSNLQLTVSDLATLQRRLERFLVDATAEFRGRGRIPGSRPVQLQMNLFPVIDGEVAPDPGEDAE
jgi:DNA-binding transcriptional ArsR family regulator